MIIKITPDKERARSMLQMAESRRGFLKSFKHPEAYATITVENYYEIIKELCLAIGFVEGYKCIGENAHKESIQLMKRYKVFTTEDIEMMQDLRIRRNKSSYEGKPVEPIYLKNKEKDLLAVIEKLKRTLRELL